MERKIKVHFGCGHHRLEGWINVDLSRSLKPDIIADLRQDLPFRTQSLAYIHSEDFIEHMQLEEGIHFLQECHRVLKEGGVMRLLTPDLHRFAKRYVKRDMRLLKQWNELVGVPLKTRKLAEIFNAGMRSGGHTFLYDEEILSAILKNTGFEPKRVRFNYSKEAELRGLDVRSRETGISLYYDCYKPKRNRGSGTSSHLFNPVEWLKRLLRG